MAGGGELDLVALASEATDRFCDRVPDYEQRYADGVGRAWAMHDLQHLINWAALDVAGQTSLDEQVAWLAGVLAARDFPGSSIRRGTTAQGTTAPRGTSACLTDPLSADCTSCGFSASCDASTASCQKIKADPICKTSGAPPSTGPGYDGFFAADKDDLNVRMFDMRRRFGISPLFPVTRYSIGLTKRRVPSRVTEHVESKLASGQRMLADYVQSTACTNPLFASNLPEKPGDRWRLPIFVKTDAEGRFQ